MFKCMALSMLRQADRMKPLQLFSREAASLGHDWSMAKLRRVLTAKLEHVDTSVEMRQLCIRLLLKIGLVCGNAEDLLLAATSEHPTDLTLSLEYFCQPGAGDPEELASAKATVLERLGTCPRRLRGEEAEHAARQSLIQDLITGAAEDVLDSVYNNDDDDVDQVDHQLENFAELAQIIILGEMASKARKASEAAKNGGGDGQELG